MKPRNIVPVPEELVEIYKIGKEEPIVRPAEPAENERESLGVVSAMLGRDRAPSEQIVHLADAGARNVRVRQRIEERLLGRLNREIAAVRRARVMARRPDERPRDHAGDVVW